METCQLPDLIKQRSEWWIDRAKDSEDGDFLPVIKTKESSLRKKINILTPVKRFKPFLRVLILWSNILLLFLVRKAFFPHVWLVVGRFLFDQVKLYILLVGELFLQITKTRILTVLYFLRRMTLLGRTGGVAHHRCLGGASVGWARWSVQRSFCGGDEAQQKRCDQVVYFMFYTWWCLRCFLFFVNELCLRWLSVVILLANLAFDKLDMWAFELQHFNCNLHQWHRKKKRKKTLFTSRNILKPSGFYRQNWSKPRVLNVFAGFWWWFR